MSSAAIKFDKLAHVDRLRSGGVDENQARVHAEVLDIALGETVATKTDIEAVRRDIERLEAAVEAMRRDIERMEAALRADIDRLESSVRADIERLEAANKADKERPEAANKAEMGLLRAEVRAEIGSLKMEMARWIIGAVLALGGFFVAVEKLLR